jgi:S-adenosylmethionine/arginine decarboxylase-like enzyme
MGRYWGTHLTVDLGGCDPAVTGDPDAICRWALDLCALIGMRPYGEPLVEHFGQDALAGWTVVQLIETSNLVVHANDVDHSVFVDVFSCRPFDVGKAAAFTADRFGAQSSTWRVLERHVPDPG